VTDVLADYAQEHGPHISTPWRIAYAVAGLAEFWEGRTVAEVTKEACRRYGIARERSAGTVRRELGVLRAAINHAYREGRVTRAVAVHLPDKPDPRDRWLSRSEAAALLRAALREPRVKQGKGRKRFYPCGGRRWTLRATASISIVLAPVERTSVAQKSQYLRSFCRTFGAPVCVARNLVLSSMKTATASTTSSAGSLVRAGGPVWRA
jgi:hypothetical protein